VFHEPPHEVQRLSCIGFAYLIHDGAELRLEILDQALPILRVAWQRRCLN
jgi:hypothetical protein